MNGFASINSKQTYHRQTTTTMKADWQEWQEVMINLLGIRDVKPDEQAGEYYIRLLAQKAPSQTNKAREIIRRDMMRK